MKELLLVIIILVTLVGLSMGLTVNKNTFASPQVVNKIIDSCKKTLNKTIYSVAELNGDLMHCINQKLDTLDYRLITELPVFDND
ncbi:hypothetical protein AADZ91_04385 [Colwelliaceae bacterium 6441]